MKTDLPATLYWLGNDLMWINYRIYQNAPVETILEGVTSARQYLVDLEADSLAVAFLDTARIDIENRNFHFALRCINSVKGYIYRELIKAQPDFKKLGYKR